MSSGRLQLSLAVIAAAFTGACVSAEGDVFRSAARGTDGGVGSFCAPAGLVLASATDVRLGGGLSGRSPTVVASLDGVTRGFTLALTAAGAAIAREDGLAGDWWFGAAQPLEAPDGSRSLLFGNHHAAGTWHVFTHPWGELRLEDLFRVSTDAVENIGPRGAYRGDEMGVAYRQEAALAFARVARGQVLSRWVEPTASTHPTIDRVFAMPAAHAVLFRRLEAEVAFFDAQGQPAGSARLGGFPADVFSDESGLAALVVRDGDLALVRPAAGTTDPGRMVATGLGTVARIKVHRGRSGTIVALWRSAGGGRLEVSSLTTSGLVGAAAVDAPLPGEPDLLIVEGDTHVGVFTNEQRGEQPSLVGRTLCP